MCAGAELLLNCVILEEVNVLLPMFSRVLWSGFDTNTAINLSYLRTRCVGQSYDCLSLSLSLSLCSAQWPVLQWLSRKSQGEFLIFFFSLSLYHASHSTGVEMACVWHHQVHMQSVPADFRRIQTPVIHSVLHNPCLLHVRWLSILA